MGTDELTPEKLGVILLLHKPGIVHTLRPKLVETITGVGKSLGKLHLEVDCWLIQFFGI